MIELLRAALWIRPPAPARATLEAALDSARLRFGGPRFEPHVTLLGGIELPAAQAQPRLQQLAHGLKPFTIRLDRIDRRPGEYFRRLFLRVEPRPGLAAARRAAQSCFDGKGGAEFEPHLSLVYGDAAVAVQELAEFETLVGLEFGVESLCLVNAAREVPVEQWRTVAEATLAPDEGVE